MGGRSETYTHGHHESVLRSHRWRTAENSAAYLLPHLAPGARPARRRVRPGHDHRSTSPRAVAPGRVVGIDAAEDVLAPPGPRPPRPGSANVDLRGRRRLRARLRRRHASTSSTPTRCSSTSPIPVAALRGDAPGVPGRRARGGPRQRLRRDGLVSRGPGPGPLARAVRAGRPRATAASPTPVGGSWRGRSRPGFDGRHAVGVASGASRRPRTAPGGAACGRTG